MIRPDQETYILKHAYIPEHTAGLMTYLSGGEPFLIDDFFCCRRSDWIVLIGYPLRESFTIEKLVDFVERAKKRFRPKHVSLIAPELPPSILHNCRERASDDYFTLQTGTPFIPESVRRNLKTAGRNLTVECAGAMGEEHGHLMDEFVNRVDPPAAVRALLFKMPGYLKQGRRSYVLNAWDTGGNLSAFYVIDLAAENFCNYLIGCYSKKNYVRGASDLLLWETIRVSRRHEKKYIHLGLGVNPGIRRFKEKWGGRATIPYEMGELYPKGFSLLETLMAMTKPDK